MHLRPWGRALVYEAHKVKTSKMKESRLDMEYEKDEERSI